MWCPAQCLITSWQPYCTCQILCSKKTLHTTQTHTHAHTHIRTGCGSSRKALVARTVQWLARARVLRVSRTHTYTHTHIYIYIYIHIYIYIYTLTGCGSAMKAEVARTVQWLARAEVLHVTRTYTHIYIHSQAAAVQEKPWWHARYSGLHVPDCYM